MFANDIPLHYSRLLSSVKGFRVIRYTYSTFRGHLLGGGGGGEGGSTTYCRHSMLKRENFKDVCAVIRMMTHSHQCHEVHKLTT